MYEKILRGKYDMESYHSQNTSDSEEEYEMPKTIDCNHCRFRCLDNLILEIHMDKEHTIKCPSCKFIFSDNEKLKKHMSVSHSYLTPELAQLLSIQKDSGLKVHTDLTHRYVSGNQGKVECSHCPEKFSDISQMKKHNKKEHRFPCKQCPKTFKEKLTLIMHKNEYHLEKIVESRNSLTPASGALSLDTAPQASQGSGGN